MVKRTIRLPGCRRPQTKHCSQRLAAVGCEVEFSEKWSALSDWWTPLDGGTGTCHGHSADENLLEMSRQIDEAVHVGVVTVSGNANGEHDIGVKQPPELHQKPESSEGDREISRKKRQHDHLHLSSIEGAPQAPPCGAQMVNTGNQGSRRQRSITRSKTVATCHHFSDTAGSTTGWHPF